jgi:RNA polymerase sigma-70 factor (ECF subfamily)
MTPAAALDALLRADRGRILAALIARTGDFGRAEDALQEAAAAALVHWGRSGVPARPMAWILRTALRKAIDGYRRGARGAAAAAALVVLARDEADDPDPETIPDERLRLIFACCHPALEPKTRVALTLRTLCGLTTAEIARVFLDAEPAMGQRLSRARAKIAAAGIPLAVPSAADLPDRLGSVLTVIYLIFTAGYAAGPAAGRDLCDEALFLARLTDALAPGASETEGCLALLLLTHARRAARTGPDGATVPLPGQDRGLWDGAQIAEGLAILDRAIARRAPGPFQIKAAIAGCHVARGPTDWQQVAALFDSLLRHEPTDVVRLNRAVALAEAFGPVAGLAAALPLAAALDGYQPLHAALARMHALAGDAAAARVAYDRAIALAQSPADAAYLRRQRLMLNC